MQGRRKRIRYQNLCKAAGAFSLGIFIVLGLLSFEQQVGAAIVATGDLDPADPSTWDDTTTALVGHISDGSLTVDAGDDLLSLHAYIAHASGQTGEVTIDGPDSTWTNGCDIKVGYAGNGMLNISNGATVSDNSAYIGGHYNSPSGATGVATVSGAGSSWTHRGYLYVGYSDSGTMNIYSGGSVSTLFDISLGYQSGSIGESHVNGTSSAWTTKYDLIVGYWGDGTLNITNGGEVSNTSGHIGYKVGSIGRVIVDGVGSKWTNYSKLYPSPLYVGESGKGFLNITDGGAVSSRDGHIGYNTNSSGQVRVDGSGSNWIIRDSLRVGDLGSGTLTISGGALVDNTDGFIGCDSSLTCKATVNGIGSKWNNTESLQLGNATLSIIDGGKVYNTIGYIANKAGSNSVVSVDGPGAMWTSRENLYIGYSGSGVLNISNGGTVSVEHYTWVAKNEGSTGAINFNHGTLTTAFLGCSVDCLSGTGTINTHGLISDVNLIFNATNPLNQTFNINDIPGQDITINLHVDSTVDMGIGYSGVGTMSVADGIVLESRHGHIGYKYGSTGNVTVNGAESKWNNRYYLFVGREGNGSLKIADSGFAGSSMAYVGYSSGSTGKAIVDGDGSIWFPGELRIGSSGNGSLYVNKGGVVRSLTAYISEKAGSNGEVTIDGVGSIWNTTKRFLFVGNTGNGALSILNGGEVLSGNPSSYWHDYGTIGHNSGSIGKVLVDGAGSSWKNDSYLFVGYSGSGSLNVTRGGTVSNIDGYIAYSDTSIGVVSICGDNSSWINSSELFVGYSGNGTLKIIDSGLVSVAEVLTVDEDCDGDSFINMAADGMLALFGQADGSITDFLELVEGSDAIRYWDYSISDWVDINSGTYDEDYTLEYLTEGDLAGYTVLTACMPEPTVPGDVNYDGVVDDADAAVLAMYWQTESGAFWGMGDFNDDGAVDDIDATILAANWQHGVDAGPSVPEPSIVCGLVGLCLAGVMGRRRGIA